MDQTSLWTEREGCRYQDDDSWQREPRHAESSSAQVQLRKLRCLSVCLIPTFKLRQQRLLLLVCRGRRSRLWRGSTASEFGRLCRLTASRTVYNAATGPATQRPIAQKNIRAPNIARTESSSNRYGRSEKLRLRRCRMRSLNRKSGTRARHFRQMFATASSARRRCR